MAEERYQPEVTDFRSLLTKLFAESPDALHIAPQSEFSAGTIIKQARELGYEGPHICRDGLRGYDGPGDRGRRGDGDEGHHRRPRPGQREGAGGPEANFRERYNYVTLPWHLGSAYDDVYITAECLKKTNDDQDADGFRDCMYEITWSGAIGDDYSFDSDGEVVGLSRVVVEVLPEAERTPDRKYKVLGPAPRP